MKIKIKNEPLRLVFSHMERAIIRRRLRAAKRQCLTWVTVSALGSSAILGGAHGYGEVPYEVQIDRVLAEMNQKTSDDISVASCRGNYYVYSATRRTIWFCEDDPRHVAFRARLKAAVEAQGLWPDVNCFLVLVGFLGLLLSFFGVAEALFDTWKYRKYGNDLDAFLRRFNRVG